MVIQCVSGICIVTNNIKNVINCCKNIKHFVQNIRRIIKGYSVLKTNENYICLSLKYVYPPDR